MRYRGKKVSEEKGQPSVHDNDSTEFVEEGEALTWWVQDGGATPLPKTIHRVEPTAFIRLDERTNELVCDDPALAAMVRLATNGDPKMIKNLLRQDQSLLRRKILTDGTHWIRMLLMSKNLDRALDENFKDPLGATKICLQIIQELRAKSKSTQTVIKGEKGVERLITKSSTLATEELGEIERELLGLVEKGRQAKNKS